jgi:predicted DNA-binding transcriptional regulator AlpA
VKKKSERKQEREARLQQEREAQRQRDEKSRQRALEADNDHKILTLPEWQALNGISKATGQRIRKRGGGPATVQLSERRVGITLKANREWLERRPKPTTLREKSPGC